jgi:hypothetical protein
MTIMNAIIIRFILKTLLYYKDFGDVVHFFCPMSSRLPTPYRCYSLCTSINRFEAKMAAGDITVSSLGKESPNRSRIFS